MEFGYAVFLLGMVGLPDKILVTLKNCCAIGRMIAEGKRCVM